MIDKHYVDEPLSTTNITIALWTKVYLVWQSHEQFQHYRCLEMKKMSSYAQRKLHWEKVSE